MVVHLSLLCAHWDVPIHEMTITQYDISGIVKIINDLKNRQTIPEYILAKIWEQRHKMTSTQLLSALQHVIAAE